MLRNCVEACSYNSGFMKERFVGNEGQYEGNTKSQTCNARASQEVEAASEWVVYYRE